MNFFRHERHKDLLLGLNFSILTKYPDREKYSGKYEKSCVNCAGPAEPQPIILELAMI